MKGEVHTRTLRTFRLILDEDECNLLLSELAETIHLGGHLSGSVEALRQALLNAEEPF